MKANLSFELQVLDNFLRDYRKPSASNNLRKLQLCKYHVSKKVVDEIRFRCHLNIHNLPYSDRYFNTDWQLDMTVEKKKCTDSGNFP